MREKRYEEERIEEDDGVDLKLRQQKGDFNLVQLFKIYCPKSLN